MAPRTADKQQKREKILRAALKVFSRQGLYNFKMIDIAQKAGVGKGTLYEYFPSKDDLMRRAIGLMLTDYEALLARRIADLSRPAEQVRAIISTTCEFFSRPRGRLQIMFDLWAASVPRTKGKPLLTDIKEMYRRTTKWLSAIISEGINQGDFKRVDPNFAALVMMATLDGVMFQAALGLVTLDDPEVPEKLGRAILDGVM